MYIKYICACNNNQWQKEAMSLKESREGCLRVLGGRKGKEDTV